jgi:BirA family biotin operon repressor/biotin-[acetyl-CoA-carboxylase] ligase
MRDAAEEAAGLADGTIWLKWPNDLVAIVEGRGVVKVAGVLGESVSSARRVQSAVIGIGVNGNWRAADFPWLLAATMTSLRQLSGNRPIDHAALLDSFLARLEPRYEALLDGSFDAAGWSVTQITTGRQVVVDVAGESLLGTGAGVDPESGGLLLDVAGGGRRVIDSGEVTRCRVNHAR